MGSCSSSILSKDFITENEYYKAIAQCHTSKLHTQLQYTILSDSLIMHGATLVLGKIAVCSLYINSPNNHDNYIINVILANHIAKSEGLNLIPSFLMFSWVSWYRDPLRRPMAGVRDFLSFHFHLQSTWPQDLLPHICEQCLYNLPCRYHLVLHFLVWIHPSGGVTKEQKRKRIISTNYLQSLCTLMCIPL